jgi:hypothetical protein
MSIQTPIAFTVEAIDFDKRAEKAQPDISLVNDKIGNLVANTNQYFVVSFQTGTDMSGLSFAANTPQGKHSQQIPAH